MKTKKLRSFEDWRAKRIIVKTIVIQFYIICIVITSLLVYYKGIAYMPLYPLMLLLGIILFASSINYRNDYLTYADYVRDVYNYNSEVKKKGIKSRRNDKKKL